MPSRAVLLSLVLAGCGCRCPVPVPPACPAPAIQAPALQPSGAASVEPVSASGPTQPRVRPSSAANSLAEQYAQAKPISVQAGEASYYAASLIGRKTASGEPYDAKAFTAAHRKLPFGTVARVVRVDGGQTVYVRVTDRGPFGKASRIIDLSRAAAAQLEMLRAGVVQVRVEVLQLPEE